MTRRRRMTTALLGVLLAGCTTPVPGTPQALPPPPPPPEPVVDDYGAPLTAAQKQSQLDMQTYRSWHPCSLLDRSVAEQVGTITYVTSGYLTEQSCEIIVNAPGGRPREDGLFSVKIGDLVSDFDRTPDTVDVDGMTFFQKNQEGDLASCAFTTIVGSNRTVSSYFTWLRSGPFPAERCAVARTMLPAVVRGIRNPQLRDGSPYPPGAVFAGQDPCAVIRPLTTAGWTVEWDPAGQMDLGRCEFEAWQGQEPTTYERALQKTDRSVNIYIGRTVPTSLPNTVDITVAGFPAMQTETNKTIGGYPYLRCELAIAGREPVDNGHPPDERGPDVRQLKITSDTCENAQDIATKALPLLDFR